MTVAFPGCFLTSSHDQLNQILFRFWQICLLTELFFGFVLIFYCRVYVFDVRSCNWGNTIEFAIPIDWSVNSLSRKFIWWSCCISVTFGSPSELAEFLPVFHEHLDFFLIKFSNHFLVKFHSFIFSLVSSFWPFFGFIVGYSGCNPRVLIAWILPIYSSALIFISTHIR